MKHIPIVTFRYFAIKSKQVLITSKANHQTKLALQFILSLIAMNVQKRFAINCDYRDDFAISLNASNVDDVNATSAEILRQKVIP